MKIALRVREDTGEVYVLSRGSSGNFEFGDPLLGKEKHHSKNIIEFSMIAEAFDAISRGLHPRMLGMATQQFNMISPENIQILEVPS